MADASFFPALMRVCAMCAQQNASRWPIRTTYTSYIFVFIQDLALEAWIEHV